MYKNRDNSQISTIHWAEQQGGYQCGQNQGSEIYI